MADRGKISEILSIRLQGSRGDAKRTEVFCADGAQCG